jgi:hypothetical protein
MTHRFHHIADRGERGLHEPGAGRPEKSAPAAIGVATGRMCSEIAHSTCHGATPPSIDC